MMRLFCILILSLVVSSCEADYTPPYLLYWAKFDVAQVNDVDAAVKEIAKKWDLRVYEKDRKQMKFHTQGKEAFYIVLYFNEDSILSIGNSGFGESLALMAVNHGNMPISDLERLTAEVIKTLKDRFDIEFKKSDESTASVDVRNQ